MAQRYDSYEVKYARVNATDDGDNTVVAAVTGKSIVVIGYAVNANAAGVVTFKDATATHASFELTDGGSVTYAGGTSCPAFRVTKGAALVVNNAAGVDCLGHLSYVLES